MLKGVEVPAGILNLDHSAVSKSETKSTAKFTFYFHSTNSGIYKTVETIGSKQETHWGVFQLK
ncbi:MAG: hypothetical protein WEB53_08945 [Akkermansiaceae bacterium]